MTFQLIQWAAICRLQSVQLCSGPYSIRCRHCFPTVLFTLVLFPFPLITANISLLMAIVLAAVCMSLHIQMIYHSILNQFLENVLVLLDSAFHYSTSLLQKPLHGASPTNKRHIYVHKVPIVRVYGAEFGEIFRCKYFTVMRTFLH